MDEKSPDSIIGALRIIEILSNINEFEEFSGKEFNKSFEGYKFSLECAVRFLIYSVIYDSSLPLSEDKILYRARFKGVLISEVPNTCEKTIIIKVLESELVRLSEARNKEELEKTIRLLKNRIDPLFFIYENVNINKTVEKKSLDQVIDYLGLLYIHIFFVDTSRGYPLGYMVTVLESNLTKEKMHSYFKGYQKSLKFILGNLYSKIRGKKSYEIDKSEELFPENELIDPFEIKLKKEVESEILRWRSIDRFFGIIQEEIIDPLEKEFGKNRLNYLLIKESSDFNGMKKILNSKVGEPKYLHKKDKFSIQKKLDLEFEFYDDIEILDTQRTASFNGVIVLNSLLRGFSSIKGEASEDDSISVRRFVHPQGDIGSTYSYAVLIDQYGSISDGSGWILFYDCCNDFSGTGGGHHKQAEDLIKFYKSEGLVELKEFKVSLENFREYLSEKSIDEKNGKRYLEEIEKAEIAKTEGTHLGGAKGALLELLVYYIYSKESDVVKIEWSVGPKYKLDEVDIVCKSKNKIIFYECKYSKLSRRKLNEKVNDLMSDEKFKKEWEVDKEHVVEKVYIFGRENIIDRAKLEKKGYKVLSVEKDFRTKFQKHKNKLKNINYLFENKFKDLI